jgi:hypothetical protein
MGTVLPRSGWRDVCHFAKWHELIGKVEIAKKYGKTSDLRGPFATLPGPQAAARLSNSKVTG